MKQTDSFRTTLKVSRYLFRTLVSLLWVLGVLLSTFFVNNTLHERESDIHQEYNASLSRARNYILQTLNLLNEVKFFSLSQLNKAGWQAAHAYPASRAPGSLSPERYSLLPGRRCAADEISNSATLNALGDYLNYWKENTAMSREINRVFLIGGDNVCLAEFNLRHLQPMQNRALRSMYNHIMQYHNLKQSLRSDYLFWIMPSLQSGTGYLYALLPVVPENQQQLWLGIELPLHLSEFKVAGKYAYSVALLDAHNQPALIYDEQEALMLDAADWPQERNWFGYAKGHRALVLKGHLAPTPFSLTYTLPFGQIIDTFRMLILKTVFLNVFSGLLLFTLAWLFERKMFIPAEDNVDSLEEHEQFNEKVITSAPVGIAILRISDGVSLLSNTLAISYLSKVTREDRQRLISSISNHQKYANFFEILTTDNTDLQISFVRSRYKNVEVAICVLVDISMRVRMEKSLQDAAKEATQASQAKSMFLATVSHELRTPLYGLMGNLEMLLRRQLPEDIHRQLGIMYGSSNLLLKIINDILDFSKLESEQLKIEQREFSPYQLIHTICNNGVSLILKKHLELFCFIDPRLPARMVGDDIRLQQIISNLLNNATKFTDNGSIIIYVDIDETARYLVVRIRDTGIGIPERDVKRLFDPFFQVGNSTQNYFQGSGLGLAICEKLCSMMQGDISVESGEGLGSLFTVRIPLGIVQPAELETPPVLKVRHYWLDIRNIELEQYLQRLLEAYGLSVSRWQGEARDRRDWLITDYPQPDQLQVIQFSSTHMDEPRMRTLNYWLHSTVTPYRLPMLLARIYGETPVSDGRKFAVAPVRTRDNRDIRVLIVDDHPVNREVLSNQLKVLGYPFATACDGVDALAQLKGGQFDIILSDVNMPNMNGYSMTQKIREQGLTLPVIGVTANALAEEKQRCLASGMDSCLSKPITLESLSQMLMQYAEIIRQQREAIS